MANDGSVLSYDEANLDFTAKSTDESLIGFTYTYGLIAEFENYPIGGPTDQADGTISFISQCKTPMSLIATA